MRKFDFTRSESNCFKNHLKNIKLSFPLYLDHLCDLGNEANRFEANVIEQWKKISHGQKPKQNKQNSQKYQAFSLLKSVSLVFVFESKY